MNAGKCCFDCLFCIMANASLESGINHVCIHPKGKPHYTDAWDAPCGHFREEPDKHENSKYFN